MVKHDALDFTKSIDNILDNVDGLVFCPDIFLEQDAHLDAEKISTDIYISKEALYNFSKIFYRLKTQYDYNFRYYLMVRVHFVKD